ncbi:Imm53 family immunity protein [Streptomyces sp. NPDC001787]|uniref:Imm53 family immunity protein n=1 Tax=Streptomyces sp. NPDC001787 TaxID=3154523 RepID=UPI00331FAA76
MGIDLEQRGLEGREYTLQEVSRSTQGWVHTWTAEKIFHAACGPGNLAEAPTLFRGPGLQRPSLEPLYSRRHRTGQPVRSEQQPAERPSSAPHPTALSPPPRRPRPGSRVR